MDEVDHHALLQKLRTDFPDGWALSTNVPSLEGILAQCPASVRIGAWVKPFAIFKPGVGVAYAWEPVIFFGGRKRTRQQPTVRDWVSANVTLKKGLVGAKPEKVCRWILDVLNFQSMDQLEDLFPGTGVMGRIIESIASCGGFQPMPNQFTTCIVCGRGQSEHR